MSTNSKKLTARQERFACNVFSGMTQRAAWIAAGYSSNYSMAVLDVHASQLAALNKVKIRIAELREKADAELVASVLERRKVATEVLRGRLGDFIDEGGEVITDKDKLRSAAVSELSVTTVTTKAGRTTTRRSIKLRDPLSGADLLNKMDRLYQDAPVVSQDNRTLNFVFLDQGTQEGTKAIIEGAIRRELPGEKKG